MITLLKIEKELKHDIDCYKEIQICVCEVDEKIKIMRNYIFIPNGRGMFDEIGPQPLTLNTVKKTRINRVLRYAQEQGYSLYKIQREPDLSEISITLGRFWPSKNMQI